MMAAAQPFISGAISKTINMPASASIDDIREAYELSHSTMNKACAVYRDGSKLSQPLMSQIVDTSILEEEDSSGTVGDMVEDAVKAIPVPDDLARPIAENVVQSFIAARRPCQMFVHRRPRSLASEGTQFTSHRVNMKMGDWVKS